MRTVTSGARNFNGVSRNETASTIPSHTNVTAVATAAAGFMDWLLSARAGVAHLPVRGLRAVASRCARHRSGSTNGSSRSTVTGVQRAAIAPCISPRCSEQTIPAPDSTSSRNGQCRNPSCPWRPRIAARA